MLLTLKKSQTNSIDRNSESTKDQRVAYAQWFLTNLNSFDVTVFVDECGYNLWTRRSNGRSLKGLPAIHVVNGSKGKNLSLVLAISPQLGCLSNKFINGSVNHDNFQAYLNELSNSIGLEKKAVFIMDNASIHKNMQISCQNHILKFLPPYSPALNPIEEAFSTWKWSVKNELARAEVQLRINDRSAATAMGSNLMDYRRGILQQIGESALPCITSNTILQWHHHSLSFFPKCQNREDF